jgi:hypothetical protein
MSNVALVMDILARDKASKTLKDVGANAEKTGGKFHDVGTKTKVAMAAGAGALIAFGKQSADTFQNVGKETLKLQRSIGGTAEEASRLRFAAEETGTDIDVFTKGLGLLSKNLVGSKDKVKDITRHVEVATGAWRKQTTIVKDASGNFQKIEKMVPVTKMKTLHEAVRITNPLIAQLGIKVKDATGHIRPMNELLPEIAEKFKSMPAGAEKTAFAMKLFGKNGVTMLPFLNRGAKGIEELEKQSDKLGNTLSGKDLQAVKDNTKAKREWHAAIQGVQIQLGRNLFPILTKGAQTLAQVAAFVERNGTVMKPLIATVAGLAAVFWGVTVAQKAWGAATALWTGIQKAAAAAQWLFNAALDANPIGIVIVAIAALTAGLIYAYKHSATFRAIVQGAFQGVKIAFEIMWVALKAGFNWVKDHWKLILGILTGPIGAAVIFIVSHWNVIHSTAIALVAKIKASVAKVKDAVVAPFKAAFDFVMAGWNKIKGIVDKLGGVISKIGGAINSVGGVIGDIPGFASGTRSAPSGLALVGERGPELVRFRGGEQVVSASRTSGMLSGSAPVSGRGGGVVIEVHFNQPIDPQAAARELRKLLNSQVNLGVAG